MRILVLGTYPLAWPLHGGQRRAVAIREGYVRHNIPYRHIAVYESTAFPEAERGRDDILMGPVDPRLDPVAQVADIRAGLFAAGNDVAFQRILKVARSFNPTHIQLENIYLWPAFQRLAEFPQFPALKLIYSSHHQAGRAKREVLKYWSLPAPFVEEMGCMVDTWELEAASAAELVIAASTEDKARYVEMGAKEVILARNGVGHFPGGPLPADAAQKLGGQRFLLTVGSDQPHNVAGFLKLLADPAMSFAPVKPVIVVCGLMANGLGRHPEFGKAREKGDRRLVLAADANDRFLGQLKHSCHGYALPVLSGTGTRLKTAEALVGCKYIVATRLAFRGYEDYMHAPGVILADDPHTFRTAMTDVLGAPLLEVSEAERLRRQQLQWQHTLKPLFERLTREDNDTLAAAEDTLAQDSITGTEKTNVARFMNRAGVGATSRAWAADASYDELLVEVIRRVLHRDSNALEVGVAQGDLLRSILRAAPRGTHYAFEPRPETFVELHNAYGHLSNVRLFDVLPSSATEEVAPRVGRKTGSGIGVVDPDQLDDIAAASAPRTERLDNLVSPLMGIDLIILGIVGTELEALRGGIETVRRCRPLITLRCNYSGGRLSSSEIGGRLAPSEIGGRLSSSEIGGRLAPSEIGGRLSSGAPEELFSLLVSQCSLKLRLMSDWLRDRDAPELNREDFLEACRSHPELQLVATP